MERFDSAWIPLSGALQTSIASRLSRLVASIDSMAQFYLYHSPFGISLTLGVLFVSILVCMVFLKQKNNVFSVDTLNIHLC